MSPEHQIVDGLSGDNQGLYPGGTQVDVRDRAQLIVHELLNNLRHLFGIHIPLDRALADAQHAEGEVLGKGKIPLLEHRQLGAAEAHVQNGHLLCQSSVEVLLVAGHRLIAHIAVFRIAGRDQLKPRADPDLIQNNQSVSRLTIDGKRMQRFSPRKKNSPWTELNKARVRRLESLGRMTDLGRAVLPHVPQVVHLPYSVLFADVIDDQLCIE